MIETSIGRILHVGCGSGKLPEWLKGEETRVDICPDGNPDICSSMTSMPLVGNDEYEVVYSSHSLEHLYPHEIHKTIGEFWRVLVKGGMVLVVVPDLEGVLPTEDVLFQSEAGPISGLDMYFGHRPQVEKSLHMAHHSGFVRETLQAALSTAPFRSVKVERMNNWQLFGVAVK